MKSVCQRSVHKKRPHKIVKNWPLLLSPKIVCTGSTLLLSVRTNNKVRKNPEFFTSKSADIRIWPSHLKTFPLVRKISALDNPLFSWLRTSFIGSPIWKWLWYHTKFAKKSQRLRIQTRNRIKLTEFEIKQIKVKCRILHYNFFSCQLQDISVLKLIKMSYRLPASYLTRWKKDRN